ncbi:MAG: hypothetical protein K2G77_00310 [Muribaculaceae bacterium]|nr:hypothetical protein [Muribaculaceae bacterium]
MNAGLISPISGIVLIVKVTLALAMDTGTSLLDYKDIGAWPEVMINDQRLMINDERSIIEESGKIIGF